MRKMLTAAAIFVAALGASAAGATRFSNLFVFGDSLVDAGNAHADQVAKGKKDPAPPTSGYFDGRFSNGYNFADRLSQDLFGTPTSAAYYGGSNFAVGGAQSSERIGDESPSFVEQIALFKDSGQAINETSLILLTFGGNDIRTELTRLATIPRYVPNLQPAIDALGTGIDQLVLLGASNIVVTGLPNLGQIPEVTLNGLTPTNATAQALSSGLNAAFASKVATLAKTEPANLQFFNLFAFQQQIYTDPGTYALDANLDTTHSCLLAGAAPACDGYVYFDPIHPTADVHRVIGDALFAEVSAVPEPGEWALMIGGFGLIGATMRRRRAVIAADPTLT